MSSEHNDGEGHLASKKRSQMRPLTATAGQLTYVPARKGQDVGELRRNRLVKEATFFHQITPYQQWLPPSRAAPAARRRHVKPSDTATSQNNWLLHAYPEAYTGIMCHSVDALLLKEIKTTPTSGHSSSPAPTLSVLAVGEILDVRSPGHLRLFRVAAFPSGEFGHTLRLVGLARQEWSGGVESSTDAGPCAVNRLHYPSQYPPIEGAWLREGSTAITAIRFATDARRPKDRIGWLVVQTPTCTTVFQPEVRRLPQRPMPEFQGGQQAWHISMNPLFSVSMEQTGGGVHADVSFSAVSDNRGPPQLAILDEAGRWSVWSVKGYRQAARPMALMPELRLCGDVMRANELIPPPLNGRESVVSGGGVHKILWMRRQEGGDSGGLKQDATDTSDLDAPPSARHCDLLLFGNSSALQLFDLKAQKPVPGDHFASSSKFQRIIDVKICPGNASRACVLTSTGLSWIEVKESSAGATILDVLTTVPHQLTKLGDLAPLRLDISPPRSHGSSVNHLVLIQSSRDSQTLVFSVTTSPTGVTVESCAPVDKNGLAKTHLSAQILPVMPRPDKSAWAGADDGHGPTVCFYQILSLSRDFALSCSLCATVASPHLRAIPPLAPWDPEYVPRVSLERAAERERHMLLRQVETALVVPDWLEDTGLFATQKTEQGAATRHPKAAALVKRRNLRDFSLFWQKISLVVSEQAGAPTDALPPQGIFNDAMEVATRGEENLPLRTLLDLVGRQRSVKDLLGVARCWTEGLREELTTGFGERLLVRQAHSQLQDLLVGLADFWDGIIPSNGSELLQRRWRNILRRIAAETFLSCVQLSIVPPNLLAALGGKQATGLLLVDGGHLGHLAGFSQLTVISNSQPPPPASQLPYSSQLPPSSQPPPSSQFLFPSRHLQPSSPYNPWPGSHSQPPLVGLSSQQHSIGNSITLTRQRPLSSAARMATLDPLQTSQPPPKDANIRLNDGEQDDDEEDAIYLRLSHFAPTIDRPPHRAGGRSLVLSHWELGTDPDREPDFDVRTPGRGGGGDGEWPSEVRRRQQKQEARRRRREAMAASARYVDMGMVSPSLGLARSASQPLPSISSSDYWMLSLPPGLDGGFPMSQAQSQVALLPSIRFYSEQPFPEEPMSQVAPGLFGGRPAGRVRRVARVKRSRFKFR